MASLSVIRSPKLRLQTICCFAGGASSRDMQDSPLSSRTVRSRMTLKFFRMNAVLACASCSAVLIPSAFSFSVSLRPTPQTSPTGCSPSSFKIRLRFSAVSATTPENCGHCFVAHCALFASVFVGAMPTPMVSPVQLFTCSLS
ncbi:Uncharacterised protein [Shigella sonnei]|nr:Uncharacterised protein [Shigella sonnei]